MKTDTEDGMRVTVTFRRDINPEWYELLVGINSGRARAEVVRSHLSLPRLQPTAKAPVQPPAEPAKVDTEAAAAPAASTAPDGLGVSEDAPISVNDADLNTKSQTPVTHGSLSSIEGQKKEAPATVTPRIKSGMAVATLGVDIKNPKESTVLKEGPASEGSA